MKKIILSLFFFSFLLNPSPLYAATFGVSNPVSGNCFTPGQTINLTWGSSTDPTTKHYALAYKTDGSVPTTWNIKESVDSTSYIWLIPNITSTNVRVWVEAHKNNHSRVGNEIASSGIFSIKNSCNVTPPPPPAPKPPPVAPPPQSSAETPPIVETPTEEVPTIPNEEDLSENTEYYKEGTEQTSNDSNKNISITKKTGIPKIYGMVYLLSVGLIIIGGLVYVSLHKNLILNKLNFSGFDKLKDIKLPTPEPGLKQKNVTSKKISKEYNGELTLQELENLRQKEDLP